MEEHHSKKMKVTNRSCLELFFFSKIESICIISINTYNSWTESSKKSLCATAHNDIWYTAFVVRLEVDFLWGYSSRASGRHENVGGLLIEQVLLLIWPKSGGTIEKIVQTKDLVLLVLLKWLQIWFILLHSMLA